MTSGIKNEVAGREIVTRGFSLVEVAMAMGIIAFAGLAVLGLLPTVMSSLQSASFETISARIASIARADLQQLNIASSVQGLTFFAEDGEEVEAGDPSAVYQVYRSEVPFAMPGANGGRLHRISVQIVQNPTGRPLQTDADGWATIPSNMPAQTLRFYVTR